MSGSWKVKIIAECLKRGIKRPLNQYYQHYQHCKQVLVVLVNVGIILLNPAQGSLRENLRKWKFALALVYNEHLTRVNVCNVKPCIY
jgi:hypothetical protein